jgi:cytochrome P450
MTVGALPAVFSSEFMVDPHGRIAQLRREDPVHFADDMALWFVTRHEDVKRLFADGEIVTSDRRAWEFYEAPAEGTFMRWFADNNLLALERTDHRRVRRLVNAAFTPRAIARMNTQIAEVVDRFATPLAGRTGMVDVMAEFTEPIPNTVISRITGIPPSVGDEVRFRRLARPVISNAMPFAPADTAQQAEQAMVELTAWVRQLAEERRLVPQDDLITDLITTHDMGDQMTSDEIVTLVAGLIVAGSETTALGGMIAIMTLLDHPDVFEELRADRSLIPQAVLEIIRFGMSGPGALPRYAIRDFDLRGKTIRKGQMVMLSFGGANRDPSAFDDPNRLDIRRDQSNLLSFGYGPHYCLGVHLAKAELSAIVNAVCDFLPIDAQIRPELIEFSPIGMFPRPLTLPIHFRD